MSDPVRPHTASYMLLRKGDSIALILRKNTGWKDGWYSLPSGKVDLNESFTDTAIREVKEEVGVSVKPDGLRAALVVHRYEKGSDKPYWVDAYFEITKWQGEPYNAEPHMHGELAWFDLKKLPEKIIPSVRASIEAIEAGQTYAEYGWDS